MSTLLYLLKVDLVFAVFLLAYLPLRERCPAGLPAGWLLAVAGWHGRCRCFLACWWSRSPSASPLPEGGPGCRCRTGSPLSLGWTARLPLAYAVVVAGLMLRLLVRTFGCLAQAGAEGSRSLPGAHPPAWRSRWRRP